MSFLFLVTLYFGRSHINLLQHVLIEKVGNDRGFDYVFSGDEEDVYLASASQV